MTKQENIFLTILIGAIPFVLSVFMLFQVYTPEMTEQRSEELTIAHDFILSHRDYISNMLLSNNYISDTELEEKQNELNEFHKNNGLEFYDSLYSAYYYLNELTEKELGTKSYDDSYSAVEFYIRNIDNYFKLIKE